MWTPPLTSRVAPVTSSACCACVRPSRAGASGYVNGIAAHNVVAEEHPEHLQILYRGFAKHQFGEEEAGEAPFSAPTPIFSVCEGVPTMQYIRGYYDMAKEEAGEPTVRRRKRRSTFSTKSRFAPEMKLDILHAPGDVSFINNHVIMHSRTEFADHEDPRRGRLLLRLWLHAPGSRPLIAALTDDEAHAGVSENRERETPYFGRWNATWTDRTEGSSKFGRGAVELVRSLRCYATRRAYRRSTRVPRECCRCAVRGAAAGI